jgi:hypothetical protein
MFQKTTKIVEITILYNCLLEPITAQRLAGVSVG